MGLVANHLMQLVFVPVTFAGTLEDPDCRVPYMVGMRIRLLEWRRRALAACFDRLERCVRCAIFLGLLLDCTELPDGTTALRGFPALNCDEIANRVLIGWAGMLALCVGLPVVCTILAILYLKRKFKSALSYFLVRSVFSGLKDSVAGFGFKIFCMGRTFFLVFIVTSPAWIGDVSQLVGILGLFAATLFVESITHPRTTASMNIMESFEEICLCAFVAIGFSATGSQPHWRGYSLVRKSCGACSCR